MPLLQRFDPPANINDFNDPALRQAWSNEIAGFFDSIIDVLDGVVASPQFYNPTRTETTAPFIPKLIDWDGFPKLVKSRHPGNQRAAWKEAEPTEADPAIRARFQDEYLEWNVVRNAANKITRVSFTCEGPEYWDFLAKHAPDKLVELYSALVNPALSDQVRVEDLIVNGVYRRRNKWNSRHGAVHLTHPANNLNAEVQIAALATILRKKNGEPIEDPDELTDCGQFGTAGRASDPRIGADVQGLAQDGFAITLQNPVGLYITSFSSSDFKKPDGSDVGDYWKIVRGQAATSPDGPASVLHLVYEVPASEGFVVGDIRIGDNRIEFGGQIADFVRVGLTGIACREGQLRNDPRECGDFGPPNAAPFAGLAAEALADPGIRRAQASDAPENEGLSRASVPLLKKRPR
jgi:hypothetical protein